MSQPNRLIAAVLTLIIGLAPALADPVSDAARYRTEGQLRSAVITLRRQLKEHPKDIQARLLLAQIYLDVQAGDLARQQLEQLAKLRIPEDTTATY